MASALQKIPVHVDLRTGGAITASDKAKVDAAAEIVRTQGPNTPLTADKGQTMAAIDWIRTWAFHMAKQERRDYAASVYQQLMGRPPVDTPGIVAAQNGPVAGGPKPGTGILDTLGSIFTQITGPAADRAGAAAGAANAEALKGTLLLVGVGIAAVVVVFLVARRH